MFTLLPNTHCKRNGIEQRICCFCYWVQPIRQCTNNAPTTLGSFNRRSPFPSVAAKTSGPGAVDKLDGWSAGSRTIVEKLSLGKDSSYFKGCGDWFSILVEGVLMDKKKGASSNRMAWECQGREKILKVAPHYTSEAGEISTKDPISRGSFSIAALGSEVLRLHARGRYFFFSFSGLAREDPHVCNFFRIRCRPTNWRRYTNFCEMTREQSKCSKCPIKGILRERPLKSSAYLKTLWKSHNI